MGDKLLLRFRKYVRDPSKIMEQGYLRKALQTKKLEGEKNECRQLLHMDQLLSSASPVVAETRIDSEKSHLRHGIVDSIKDSEGGADVERVAIVSGLFSQEEDIRAFARVGFSVRTTGGTGVLQGPFGKSGKCKILFTGGSHVHVGDYAFVQR